MCNLYLSAQRGKIASPLFVRGKMSPGQEHSSHTADDRSQSAAAVRLVGCSGCTMYEKRTDERTIYRSKSLVRKKYRRKFLTGAAFYSDYGSVPAQHCSKSGKLRLPHCVHHPGPRERHGRQWI